MKSTPVCFSAIFFIGGKILVVDDNNANLRVATGALEKYGANVVCTDSGKSAIPLLKPSDNFDTRYHAMANGNFSFDINGLSQPTSWSPAVACLILWFSGQFICTPGPVSFLKNDLFCMATFGMQLRSHVSVSFSLILFGLENNSSRLHFVIPNSVSFLNNFKSSKFSSLESLGSPRLIFNKIWLPFSFRQATFAFSLFFKMFLK